MQRGELLRKAGTYYKPLTPTLSPSDWEGSSRTDRQPALLLFHTRATTAVPHRGGRWLGFTPNVSGRVWRGSKGEDRTRALGLWGAQLAVNSAWSPLFFGARKPRLALGDVALLLPAIAAYTWYARKVDQPAGWMMAPYLAWVAFATLRNAEIVRRNR